MSLVSWTEFRGFAYGSKVEDEYRTHRTAGRLVWSRGHSIENYYFDFDTLLEPLRMYSATDRYEEALGLYKSIFESALRLAATVSLVGRMLGCLTLIRRSIDWKTLEIAGKSIAINIDVWSRVLMRGIKCTEERAEEIISTYESVSAQVLDTEETVVRWVCHGHIELAILWAAYARCIYEVTDHDEGITTRVMSAEEDGKFASMLVSNLGSGGHWVAAPIHQ